MVIVRLFHRSPVVALVATLASATGCGLDAACAAFTTSTTGPDSTGEPGSTGSTGECRGSICPQVKAPRILFGEGRYVRPDGEVVVDGLAELFSGHLRAPISVDELGNETDGTVWINTRQDGTAVSKTDTCNNWSYNNQIIYSHTGGTSSTDLNWTYKQSNTPQACDSIITSTASRSGGRSHEVR